MKKIMSVIMAIVVAISVLAVFPEMTQAATMSMSEKSRTICENDQFRLYVKNCSSKVSWKSKDKSIAKVSSKGIVTGVKAGSTEITAKVGKSTYTCKITVIPTLSKELDQFAKFFSYHYVPGYSVELQQMRINSISKGNYEFNYNNGVISSFDYRVSLSGVLNSGKSHEYLYYINLSRWYEVEMSMAHDMMKEEKTDINYSEEQIAEIEQRAKLIASGAYDPDADDGRIKLSKEKFALCVGDSYTLKVKNATGKAKWSSSNPSVLSVSNGKLTAKKTGSATIKVKVDGGTVSATVQVIKKYSKNMRLVIEGIQKVKWMAEYPEDIVVKRVDFGDFKYLSHNDEIHIDVQGDVVAIASISVKNSQGQKEDISCVLAYNDIWKGVYIASWGGGLDISYWGTVTSTCTEKEIEELNQFVKTDAGSLFIDKKIQFLR